MSIDHQNQTPLNGVPPSNGGDGSGYKNVNHKYPNLPDASNPRPETLREQWQYASKKYSRWYGRTWGTAVLAAGVTLFGTGWMIKGSNPLPSLRHEVERRSSLASPAPSSRPLP